MSPVLADPDAVALVAPALVAAAELGCVADEEELDELDEHKRTNSVAHPRRFPSPVAHPPSPIP